MTIDNLIMDAQKTMINNSTASNLTSLAYLSNIEAAAYELHKPLGKLLEKAVSEYVGGYTFLCQIARECELAVCMLILLVLGIGSWWLMRKVQRYLTIVQSMVGD